MGDSGSTDHLNLLCSFALLRSSQDGQISVTKLVSRKILKRVYIFLLFFIISPQTLSGYDL